MDKLVGKSNEISEERDELRKLIKRKIPDSEKEAVKGRIASLADELKTIRREQKLCEDIKERSKDVEKNLESAGIEAQQQTKMR